MAPTCLKELPEHFFSLTHARTTRTLHRKEIILNSRRKMSAKRVVSPVFAIIWLANCFCHSEFGDGLILPPVSLLNLSWNFLCVSCVRSDWLIRSVTQSSWHVSFTCCFALKSTCKRGKDSYQSSIMSESVLRQNGINYFLSACQMKCVEQFVIMIMILN